MVVDGAALAAADVVCVTVPFEPGLSTRTEIETFDGAVDATVPVLVDFWADWCGPCRMVSPVVERIGRDYAGRLKVVKLDTDAAPRIAARFQVQSIPLLVLFEDGRERDRLVGAHPDQQLRAWLDARLPAPAGAGAADG